MTPTLRSGIPLLTLVALMGACAHTSAPTASGPEEATTPPTAGADADMEKTMSPGAPEAPASNATASSLKTMWDFSDPAGTEARFLAMAQFASPTDGAIYLTQAARAQGIQGHFDAGHRTLDTLLPKLDALPDVVAIRLNLERGRLFNSAGKKGLAIPYFREAAERGMAEEHLPLAIDAVHMEAIATGGEGGIALNLKGLEMARGSADPGAQSWQGPLLNNLGWAYFEGGQYDLALSTFQEGLAFRESQEKEVPILLAIYSVARTQRALGRCAEALPSLREADARWRALGQADGYTLAELALCGYAAGDPLLAFDQAAQALALLEADPWVVENEKPLLAALREIPPPPEPEPTPSPEPTPGEGEAPTPGGDPEGGAQGEDAAPAGEGP